MMKAAAAGKATRNPFAHMMAEVEAAEATPSPQLSTPFRSVRIQEKSRHRRRRRRAVVGCRREGPV